MGSELLLDKCATFLAEKMKTAEDVFQLMLHTKESYPDADPDLLQELLRMNAEKPKTCSNCKRGLAHCVHGQSVTGLEDPPVLAKDVRVRSTGRRVGHLTSRTRRRRWKSSPRLETPPVSVSRPLLPIIWQRWRSLQQQINREVSTSASPMNANSLVLIISSYQRQKM